MKSDEMDHQQAVDSAAATRYLLGEMAELERYRFEAHYFSCETCAEEVRLGLAVQEAAADLPAEPALPPRAADRAPAWRAWGLAAAAALVAALGYQALIVMPHLATLGEPRALAPVVLRPISRGADTEIHAPANVPFMAMSLDVNLDPPPAELQYDLATAAGKVVATGRVAAPPAGTPLLMLVPRDALETGGHALTVRPADGSPGELIYRFNVVAD